MKSLMKIMLIVCLGLILSPMTGTNEAVAGNLLPGGLTVKADFKPGPGAAVGRVVRVVGKAVLIHKGEKIGYTASSGLFLYKNDTIVTLASGHLSFKLNDGSFMSLSPETRIMINKSVYSPAKKTRSSFLDLALGKARFVVQKFVDAKHSEFKVKTKTAVAGVRGSDFIIIASADETEITTLSDTILEIISLAAPDAPPAVMNAFEQAVIKTGMKKAMVKKAGAKEVERLIKEFLLKPPAIHEEGRAIHFEPVAQKQAPPAAIPEEDLVTPGRVERKLFNTARHAAGGAGISDEIEKKIKNKINSDVLNKKSENDIKTDVVDLPDFPGTPDVGTNIGTND